MTKQYYCHNTTTQIAEKQLHLHRHYHIEAGKDQLHRHYTQETTATMRNPTPPSTTTQHSQATANQGNKL